MLLVVGLGNPGPRYAGNRHNIGFMALDAVMRRHGFGPARTKFHGEIAEGRLAGRRVLALKPMTYMNDSGRAVLAAASFYRIAPPDILVLHDELDLAAGKIRVKRGGGHGGHNGLRSIHAHVGPDYRRLRFGIGHPGHREAVSPHVLKDFAKVDTEWRDKLLDAVAEHFPLLAAGDDSGFMNKIALVMAPPRRRPATGDEGEQPGDA